MVKIVVGPEEFEKLLQRFSEVIHPRRYYVVADGGACWCSYSSSRLDTYATTRSGPGGEAYSKLLVKLERRFAIVLREGVYSPT